jgi:hypothetical protein
MSFLEPQVLVFSANRYSGSTKKYKYPVLL